MNKLSPLIIVCVLFLSSCNRKIGTVFTKKDKLEVIDPDFDYLSSKAKFKFDNDGKKISATANFRIKKDSIIWISISGFGIEAIRVFIDKDYIKVLDRLKKQYYQYTFEQLSNQYGFEFSFKIVQSILLGNLIEPYTNQKYDKTDNYFKYDEPRGDYLFQNFIGLRTMKLERVNVIDESTKNTISVNYKDFIRVSNQVFPNEITAVIDYETADKPNTEIYISYNKMEIESSPLKFPYSVSSKYERK